MAAEKSNICAINLLGLHYWLTKKYELMHKYCNMGIDMYNCDAPYTLSLYYTHIEKDESKAIELLSLAAHFGNKDAMTELISYYKSIDYLTMVNKYLAMRDS
jgi:TPR repeat protein